MSAKTKDIREAVKAELDFDPLERKKQPTLPTWFRALDRYGLFADDSEVTADASDSTITLAGHVRSWLGHYPVIDAAWMGIGVSDVRDDLHVTG